MDPPGPIVEGGRKNVTLFCDVSAGNPSVLTAVRWYMDRWVDSNMEEGDVSKNRKNTIYF